MYEMKNVQRLLVLILLVCSFKAVDAQVGIGILTPDASSILHLESTDRGFLLPRMTTVQRDAILTPADGLMVYNTVDSTVQYWNGLCWLNAWQENCTDCYFDMSLTSTYEVMDRTISDSVFTDVNVIQTAGTPADVALSVLGALPAGMTFTIQNNPLSPPATTRIVWKATPFTPAGTYVFVIQGLCGSDIENIIFTIEVEPCYILDVINYTLNYKVPPDLYTTYPSAPTTTPVCVVVNVHPGVSVTSLDAAQPAFDTGILPAGSVLGLVNQGYIIGRGGDGGISWDPVAGTNGDGFDGGHAINLDMDMDIDNSGGYLFGGGGGGASMAFSISYPLGPITLGLIIGSGGGGGAGDGVGGTMTGVIGFFYYAPGADGTGGLYGVPGNGGVLNTPISFSISVVDITLNPNTVGGNGGIYGAPGTSGVFQLTLSACINIPFLGCVPIVSGINIPIPVPPPAPGAGGFAIKRNGNATNLPDAQYNTSFMKGEVGN